MFFGGGKEVTGRAQLIPGTDLVFALSSLCSLRKLLSLLQRGPPTAQLAHHLLFSIIPPNSPPAICPLGFQAHLVDQG